MKKEVKELAERIAEKEGKEVDEVIDTIKEKEKEYSGLISFEGAAHIVAKDCGLELIDDDSTSLKIENVVSGMNSATVAAKIESIFGPREFKTDKGEGKVANLILKDETGTIRFSLWNEEVDKLIEEEKIVVGDTIMIENGYVTEDNRGQPEIRLGRSGKLKETDVEIDVEISPGGSSPDGYTRTYIEDLTPGENTEIRGTVVNVFGDSPFYKKCPECDKKVEGDKCEEHDEVQVNMALSIVVDDGTDSIRSVFFRDEVEKLLGIDTEEAWEMTEEGKNMDEFVDLCEELIGNEIIIQGRVKINDFFGRPEVIANTSEEVDLKKEVKKVLKSM